MREGIEKASGGGAYRFNQRQLFYVLRPFVIEAFGTELGWANFQQIITDYEEQNGDIRGMYRDPRGTLYHPHTGQDISLGTLAVEAAPLSIRISAAGATFRFARCEPKRE